jgi:hypothetical protein
MKTVFFILFLLLCFIPAPSYVTASTTAIIGPDMKIENNDIILSSGITNVKELETVIQSGVEREIIFTFELLRSWRFWPDEFIVSKKITRAIRYDNLREHYLMTSSDGTNTEEKRFRIYDRMQSLVFSVSDINLANIRELEAGKYYIKIIVESRNMEQQPLVGFFMHLIPEVEMSIVKESAPFTVGGSR